MKNERNFYICKLQDTLCNQPINYIVKSPDMDMYDFGFGQDVITIDFNGLSTKVSKYVLHAVCNIEVMWRDKTRKSDLFFEDTPVEKATTLASCISGFKVKRVALSDKNDLWLDLGLCWIIFITNEDDEESWRFFSFSSADNAHIVATSTCLCLE